MADSYRGTTADQDVRFGNKDAKLKKSMTFPPEFSQKVDKRKVELTVFRPWIATKVTQLLGFEDEVVIEYAAGLLEDTSTSVLDPKSMQINLTGFLESKAPEFMSALWKLLLSAQQSPVGVPQEFIEQKKVEMQKKQEEQAVALQRRNDEMSDIHQSRERMDEIRQRERGDRPSRGRGRGGGFRPPLERDSGYGQRRGPPPADDSRGPAPSRRRSPSPDDRYSSRRRRSPSPYERRRRPLPSRSPSPRRRPQRSLSPEDRSPPPRRRRSPSPEDSPPPRPRRRFDSRSPPPRRRSRSPPPAKRRRDYSRSPSPPPARSRRYKDDDDRSASPPPRSRRQRYSDSSRSPSPPPRRRVERSVTPRYTAEGQPQEEDSEPQEQQGLSIKGSAGQLQERMLREKAELARRSRN